MIRCRAIAKVALFAGLCAAIAAPLEALAWGATGHRIIGRAAVEALPPDLPAFLRAPAAAQAVGELAREPDRWKGAGRMHDADRNPAHFIDLGDDGLVFGGPALAALPATRADYEKALRAVGQDSWRAGYLPYSIIDGYQQLAMDFAYWRVDTAAARNVADVTHRAWFKTDATEREALILRDLGILAHYVGDGSQPMHVSIHYNGWGPFANPNGYTELPVHGPFEGDFVRGFVTPEAVAAAMAPYHDCRCPIEARAAAFLAATGATVAPFYALEKSGGFVNGDARGRAFAAQRLAAGASELRDLIEDAWKASASGVVGWPAIKVADVEAGKIDPYDSLVGID